MPMKKLPAAILLGVLATQAHASCNKDSTPLFFCTTDKGKVIEVCDDQTTITYAFGKASEKPEIVVKVPRAAASTTQWQGVGRWMSYSVEIPNGKTTYSVFWGADRLDENHAIEAGVNVETNKKHVVTVNCASTSKIIQNLEGLQLRATP